MADFTTINSTLQDFRNLENVNENNMRILNNQSGAQFTAAYAYQPGICQSNVNFTLANKFMITSSTSTTATFSWSGASVIVRFRDQAINGYPGLSGFSNALQSIFATLSSMPNTITLTPGSGNDYVVATLSITAIDSYRANVSATLSSSTEAAPTTNNKIALFKLIDDGTGKLTTSVDNNCAYNYIDTYGMFPNYIGNAANLNDFTETGLYFQVSDAFAAAGTNYPAPAHAGALEVQAAHDAGSNFVYQTYTTYSVPAAFNKVYTRVRYTGSWSPWHELINSSAIENNISDTTSTDKVITPKYATDALIANGGGITNVDPTPFNGSITFKNNLNLIWRTASSDGGGNLFIDQTAHFTTFAQILSLVSLEGIEATFIYNGQFDNGRSAHFICKTWNSASKEWVAAGVNVIYSMIGI